MTNETALREALAALEPFAGHTDKRGETIVLKWGESTYTGTLTPEHFYRATEACRTIRHLLQSPSQPVVAEAVEPVAYLKFWWNEQRPCTRVDLSEICEPWLDALNPTITPLYAHPQASPPPVQSVDDREVNTEPVVDHESGFGDTQRPTPVDPSRGTFFSQRAKVMRAIEEPGAFVPRIVRETFIEHGAHWKARAVFKAMWEIGWRPRDSDRSGEAVETLGSTETSK